MVVHVSTIALPTDIGDFASGAVDQLQVDDVLVILFEYEAASADQPLFGRKGLPRHLTADDFSPSVLQRTIPGQAGCQFFFTEGGRAFCLYAVIGSYAQRAVLVDKVNCGLGDGADRAVLSGGAGQDAGPPRRRPHNRRRPRWCRRPRARRLRPPRRRRECARRPVRDRRAALIVLGGAFKAVDPADTAYALTHARMAACDGARARAVRPRS